MKFVTDDYRTIRLARKTKEILGVVPELDDSLMKNLLAETTGHSKPRVKVAVERCDSDVTK